MAIHKLFSKILLIQTYHTTCVSFSCQFILLALVAIWNVSVCLFYARGALMKMTDSGGSTSQKITIHSTNS